MATEICSDCGVELPISNGLSHPYIGGSPSCWECYSFLLAGSPSTAPTQFGILLNDAYCVQHHGVPTKPQAVQSVAIHLLTLHGVLGLNHKNPMWIRNRLLRGDYRNRFTWLTPPADNQRINILQIVQGESSEERAVLLEKYVKTVYNSWVKLYETTLNDWWQRFVLPDRL